MRFAKWLKRFLERGVEPGQTIPWYDRVFGFLGIIALLALPGIFVLYVMCEIDGATEDPE